MSKPIWYARIYLVTEDENAALDRMMSKCSTSAIRWALRWCEWPLVTNLANDSNASRISPG